MGKNLYLMVLFCILVSLWNVAIISHAQQVADCGAFGIDLSPLSSVDISLNVSTPTNPGYVYVVHPCGVVQDAGCVADSTSNGSMICQRGVSDAYSLGRWNTSAVIYSRDRNGIYQQLITGELCGANPRQSTVYYQCSPTDTTPRLVSAIEPSTCVYQLTILTSLTCALPSEPACVFSGVDFNPMFAQGDLNTTSGNYNWFVHMCASSTQNAQCRNDSTSTASMVCQQRIDLSDNFGIATYNESTIQWQIVPSGANAGILFTVPNGEYCAAVNRNRIARLQMICDPTLGPNSSYISGVSEPQTCLYQISIRTSLTCSVLVVPSSSTGANSLSSSWWPTPPASCSYNGYALSQMQFGSDLHWGGFITNIYYDFYFHMCGIVRNPQCLADATTYNSMICQASITNTQDNHALDYFVPGDWTWALTQYGMSYVSTIGERCGTLSRTTTVNFICDPRPTRIDSIIQDPVTQCNMNVVIKTPLVCNGTNMPPQLPECIVNGWDFRTLTGDSDLQYNTTSGYIISMRMCDIVQYQPCKRDITATMSMICQTRAVDNESYSLGNYFPGSQNWTEYTSDHVIQMRVDTGEICGNVPRATYVNFTCDLSFQNSTGLNTAIISYSEPSTCVYHLVVVANTIICPYFNGSRWNVTSSSTGGGQGGASSSSGGQSGGPGVGTGCVTGNNIPVGALAFSLVLNQPFNALTSSISSVDAINGQLLRAIDNIIHIGINFLKCGELSPGQAPVSNAVNPTTSQTLFTFYMLDGFQTGPSDNRNLNYFGELLGGAITDHPELINTQLPPGAPNVVQGQYNYVACPANEYPGPDGHCHGRDSGSGGSSLSSGAIAGIVIGAIVGAILLLGLVIFLLSRGRDRKGFSSEGGRGKGVEMTDHSEEQETEY